MRARLVWIPGYHSFPKWAINKTMITIHLQGQGCQESKVSRFETPSNSFNATLPQLVSDSDGHLHLYRYQPCRGAYLKTVQTKNWFRFNAIANLWRISTTRLRHSPPQFSCYSETFSAFFTWCFDKTFIFSLWSRSNVRFLIVCVNFRSMSSMIFIVIVYLSWTESTEIIARILLQSQEPIKFDGLLTVVDKRDKQSTPSGENMSCWGPFC